MDLIMLKKYFKSKLYESEEPSTIYDANDFKFIEIENPPIRNNTRKNNKNNINNFKYF